MGGIHEAYCACEQDELDGFKDSHYLNLLERHELYIKENLNSKDASKEMILDVNLMKNVDKNTLMINKDCYLYKISSDFCQIPNSDKPKYFSTYQDPEIISLVNSIQTQALILSSVLEKLNLFKKYSAKYFVQKGKLSSTTQPHFPHLFQENVPPQGQNNSNKFLLFDRKTLRNHGLTDKGSAAGVQALNKELKKKNLAGGKKGRPVNHYTNKTVDRWYHTCR